MPQFYTVKIEEFEEKFTSEAYFRFISIFLNSVVIGLICSWLLSIMEDNESLEKTESIKNNAVNGLFFFFINFITEYFYYYTFPIDKQHLVKEFDQRLTQYDAITIENEYREMDKEHHDMMLAFNQKENIKNKEQFTSYFIKRLKDGCCSGYSRAFHEAVSTYKEGDFTGLISRIDTKKAIMWQLRNALMQEFLMTKFKDALDISSHACSKSCICSVMMEFQKRNYFNLPALIAINRLDNRYVFSSRNKLSLEQHFRNHLTNLGFITLDRLNYLNGNLPLEQVKIEEIMPEELKLCYQKIKNDKAAKSLAECIKDRPKRAELETRRDQVIQTFLREHTKSINAKKYILCGNIHLYSAKEGHSMAYSFFSRRILFFDCNRGLYQYSNLKKFCNHLCNYIPEYYPDTEELGLTSMIVKKI